MIYIMLRAAMTAEGGAKWVKKYVTNPNGKFLFAFLFIAWAIFFGVALQLVPHTGANSPYGGIGLIALFSGFFIMMGFLWAVIGDRRGRGCARARDRVAADETRSDGRRRHRARPRRRRVVGSVGRDHRDP